MVELDCCASMQVVIIFIVNIILFFVGVVQIGIAAYFLTGGSEDLGFISDIYDGNDSAVNALLAFGVWFAIISFWGCCGAARHSKCMLWVYAIVLFFMIMGQAMTVAALAVSVNYGESIFGELWSDLEPETIDDIENTYECCSFNGNSLDSTSDDSTNYATCLLEKGFEESCWEKFEDEIDENYEMVETATAVFLGFQILIYLSTHYVIQSIAEAEGMEEAEMPESEMTGQPRV